MENGDYGLRDDPFGWIVRNPAGKLETRHIVAALRSGASGLLNCAESSDAAAVRQAIGPQRDLLIDVHSHFDRRHGLELARQYGSPALDQAAALAVQGVGGEFDGRWDEIRADLSCSRDFFTGLYFRAGLQEGQSEPILLTGCPTREGVQVDAVTAGAPVRNLIPVAEIRKLSQKPVRWIASKVRPTACNPRPSSRMPPSQARSQRNSAASAWA